MSESFTFWAASLHVFQSTLSKHLVIFLTTMFVTRQSRTVFKSTRPDSHTLDMSCIPNHACFIAPDHPLTCSLFQLWEICCFLWCSMYLFHMFFTHTLSHPTLCSPLLGSDHRQAKFDFQDLSARKRLDTPNTFLLVVSAINLLDATLPTAHNSRLCNTQFSWTQFLAKGPPANSHAMFFVTGYVSWS